MKRLKISYKNRNLGHSTIKLNNNENTLVYKFSVDGGTSSIFSVNNLFFFRWSKSCCRILDPFYKKLNQSPKEPVRLERENDEAAVHQVPLSLYVLQSKKVLVLVPQQRLVRRQLVNLQVVPVPTHRQCCIVSVHLIFLVINFIYCSYQRGVWSYTRSNPDDFLRVLDLVSEHRSVYQLLIFCFSNILITQKQ